ncbi:hypothetical protein [Nibricoccus sp. IMCC34717]|uniref:hypothetical protein n=1 Tax=Nibricoccus sp. IMCC34717 TaxID=3034021 RepID=UPI00384DBEF4
MKSSAILIALLTLSLGTSAVAATQAQLQNALAADIAETTSATNISRKAKLNLIKSSVQSAVTSGITGTREWNSVVKIAAGFGSAAAKAAPEFTEEIIASIAAIPRIAAVDGLGEEIAVAIRGVLAAVPEPETAVAGSNRGNKEPIRPFGSTRAESVVSPSTVSPTPTPKPTNVTIDIK